MAEGPVILCDTDHIRLAAFLSSLKPRGLRQTLVLYSLERVLQQAVVVGEEELPDDVVGMDCAVRLHEVPLGKEVRRTLVFPWDVDHRQGRLSVLSPLGTAILGRRVGEVVDCPGLPKRTRYLIRGLGGDQPRGR